MPMEDIVRAVQDSGDAFPFVQEEAQFFLPYAAGK